MSTPRLVLAPSFFLAALLRAGNAAPETPPLSREALELFEARLDKAVGQVSRPAPGIVLGRAESARGYHLPGYGAVFVLTPRSLPREGNVLVFRPQLLPPGTTQFQIETQIETRGSDEETAARTAAHARHVLSFGRVRGRGAAAPSLPGDDPDADELLAIEQQVLEFQREAEQARQSAEREFDRLTRDLRVRLAAPPDDERALPVVPAVVPAPRSPFASQAPPVPAHTLLPRPALPPAEVEAPEPPLAEAPLPPPPWRFWFEGGPPEIRPAGKVIADVRSAVTTILEAEGPDLRGLAPDEYVAVAIDFVPAGVFVSHARPARTMVIRARKRDLVARQEGRISDDELHRRIEVSEY